MLAITSLEAGYGDVQVLRGLTLGVQEGQIVSLLGANGAGKTTLLRVISALLRRTEGEITFDGQDIGRQSAEAVVELGISHVPQGRRIFPGLTVYENLRVARSTHRAKKGPPLAVQLERIYDMFPILSDRRDQLGWSLSGGEQQMLAVARALISLPRLILLDEPSLGLAPKVVQTLFDGIATSRKEENTTMFVVEQNAHQALRISDYVYVMEMGAVVAEGTPEELRGNAEIEKAYLGG